MEGMWRQHDQWLFRVLPYAAILAFLVGAFARRFALPPFRARPAPSPSSERVVDFGERVLFGYGILIILGGHLLAFMVPKEILLWNSEPVRLYILEASALFFGFLTLVGLVLTVAGRLSASRQQAALRSDWLLYLVLFALLGSGVFTALFYPWGSSWYATSLVPYMMSVVKLEPNIGFVSALPSIVKLHIVTTFLLLGILPFTRLMQPLLAPEDKEAQAESKNHLMTAVLFVACALSFLSLVPRLSSAHLPGNHQGYEPVQPIAFSHRLHAGELQVSCLYCHFEAERSRHAGIAPASVCMNCHRFITAPLSEVRAELQRSRQEKRSPHALVSADLAKLYTALGLNDDLKPDRTKTPRPVRWVKVHNLPAFAHFDHRPHVSAGVSCQTCHGPVQTMERVHQVEDLSMGWCVRCHRQTKLTGVAGKEVNPSIDCSTCHY
jgi:nitrate reductase gamma subunit